ncbi:peptidase inhibitor family I36 protein [Actinacidiphila paucisporea]|uniref:Peptidase inhibitor family I36 n=1 Tax=Actinacidiphila paucisporea TaxID=310782 RepID=A0A1M7QSP9_9ACTN|nr:peptidase inhibitor family I36 protein [Actinacidiphila paucisporea]SHN34359.1 Peptidase inhibitor family I36 [Actinacidiphila paucisporea]
MNLLRTRRRSPGAAALLAATIPTVLAATLTGLAPAHAATTLSPTAAQDKIACPRGFVCIYPDIDFVGQPYVKRATDGSVRHLPDYIRGAGSSIINNSDRTARVYTKDNYFGAHVCVSRDGGTISDLRSYGMNDTTHSLKNNNTLCGA